jgi:aspartate/methionine/tyrosine aminotransferase
VSHLTDDSMALTERWLGELLVAATPGLDFDLCHGARSVRFSYAGNERDLVEACVRLRDWQP